MHELELGDMTTLARNEESSEHEDDEYNDTKERCVLIVGRLVGVCVGIARGVLVVGCCVLGAIVDVGANVVLGKNDDVAVGIYVVVGACVGVLLGIKVG